MKTMKYLSMLLIMVAMSVCMVSCGDDDDDAPTDVATVIAGDYSGTLNVMGYTDQFTAYITLTRKSDTAVSLVVDCDEIDMHLNSVILDITQSNNSYKLASSSKAVNGTVIGKNLNITFSVGSKTYTFYGDK
ncbi:hypothetical protein DW036_20900 [Bacteroides sp. AF39-11AC]|jgi:hypothetical protein|nr:hypothetical protein DW036_20900 [Bacteroides sp. AF39-11AC]